MKKLLVPLGFARNEFCKPAVVKNGSLKSLEQREKRLRSKLKDLWQRRKTLGRVAYDSQEGQREAELRNQLENLRSEIADVEQDSTLQEIGPIALDKRTPREGERFEVQCRRLIEDPTGDSYIVDDIDFTDVVMVEVIGSKDGLPALQADGFDQVQILPLRDNTHLLTRCAEVMDTSITCLNLLVLEGDTNNLKPLDELIHKFSDPTIDDLSSSFNTIQYEVPWLFNAIQARDSTVKRFAELMSHERASHEWQLATLNNESEQRRLEEAFREIEKNRVCAFKSRQSMIPYFDQLLQELHHDRRTAWTILRKRRDLLESDAKRNVVLFHTHEMHRNMFRNARRKLDAIRKHAHADVCAVFSTDLGRSINRKRDADFATERAESPRKAFQALIENLHPQPRTVQEFRLEMQSTANDDKEAMKTVSAYYEAKGHYADARSYLIEFESKESPDEQLETLRSLLAVIDWQMYSPRGTELEQLWKTFRGYDQERKVQQVGDQTNRWDEQICDLLHRNRSGHPKDEEQEQDDDFWQKLELDSREMIALKTKLQEKNAEHLFYELVTLVSSDQYGTPDEHKQQIRDLLREIEAHLE